jgi:GNAT superfamily N-acetyltransferase
MEIINFFESRNREELIEKIRACDWNAARFLADLLEKGTFNETLGGWGYLFLLLDGENLVSFATLTGQDAIRDESLTPWSGFVFTQSAYRGHRYAGKVLAHAEQVAARLGYGRLYLETDHVGLYEKYGYEFLENRIDCWGEDARVLYKNLEGLQ